MAIELWGYTIRDVFALGGIFMWPLLGCSIVALTLVLDRCVAHARSALDYRAFVAALQKLVAAGRIAEALDHCSRYRNPVARTAEAYLQNIGLKDEDRASIVEREGSLALEAIENRQRGLPAVANISTLLGLLGTVAGLVQAFRQIEKAGGQIEPGDLASGIWAALLTTVFGLLVAIPSYAAFHVFESRSDRLARRMGYIVSYLDQWLHKKTTGHPAAAVESAAVGGFREE